MLPHLAAAGPNAGTSGARSRLAVGIGARRSNSKTFLGNFSYRGFSEKMFAEARLSASMRPLKDDLIGDVGRVLWVLMGTIGLVLLIACANVANLLLVRTDGAPVFLFTFLLSIAAAVLFGAIPILKYGVPQLGTALRAGGRTLSQSRERHRARNVLVVAQVALALVLLIAVSRAVWSINPDLPLANMRTMREVYDKSLARTSFTLAILSIAGGMALLLGVAGIYGVLSYAVSQRVREMGIRMALGAQRQEVTRMFVGQGVRLAGVGIAVGLVAAFALTRLIESLLFDVSAVDPLTYAGVSMVLVVVAVLASYLPALRAATVDPVGALHAE